MLMRIVVKGENYAEEIGEPIFSYTTMNDTKKITFCYVKVNGICFILEKSTGLIVINRVGSLQRFGFESICDFIAKKVPDLNKRIGESLKINELKLWIDDDE